MTFGHFFVGKISQVIMGRNMGKMVGSRHDMLMKKMVINLDVLFAYEKLNWYPWFKITVAVAIMVDAENHYDVALYHGMQSSWFILVRKFFY